MTTVKVLLISLLLVVLVVFCACSTSSVGVTTSKNTVASVTTAALITEDGIDISEYKVIRGYKANKSMVSYAAALKNELCDNISDGIKVGTDEIRINQEYDPTLKEILVGETNREESKSALAILSEKAPDGGYIIKVFENKIVILGSEDNMTGRAVKDFVVNFVRKENSGLLKIDKNYEYICTEVSDNVILKGLQEMEIKLVSKVYGPTKSDKRPTITYPRIVEIQHDEKNLGTLIATCEGLHEPLYSIHRSTDGGKSWKIISRIIDREDGLTSDWQPHLYELPNKVGDMEKGTLLLAGCSRNATKAVMTVWKSTDCGESWSLLSRVDSGGFGKDGMWEPFLICDDDGSLVCFYSDETEVAKNGGQRLVFRVSKDGITWGDKQYIVKPENLSLRPGMLTIAKMGNGKYIATYEIVGYTGNENHYKISDSLTDWGDASDLGKPVKSKDGKSCGSSPYVAWTPDGGECGTLLVTGKHMVSGSSTTGTDLFISFDYGKTWESIDNPLPYKDMGGHRMAYSPGFAVGADGTVYYVNDVNAEYGDKADLKLAILKFKK
ncbi:MAG: exo-alpha-sialidase [Clostridia bacterium]|nr:exo-alpha-sialidase [Clostridia bacterium]